MRVLYRQFGAARCAATRDHQSTLMASHTNTETMGVTAFDFFWLVSAFHISLKSVKLVKFIKRDFNTRRGDLSLWEIVTTYCWLWKNCG